jgi:hypothetical protein
VSTARALPPTSAWLRTLVLLLALLVPGIHAELHATPATAMEFVEYDALDAAVRPPADAACRTVVAPRPALPPAPAPGTREGRPAPAPPRTPYVLPVPRTVVLRC